MDDGTPTGSDAGIERLTFEMMRRPLTIGILLLFASSLLPSMLRATTTSGITPRNVLIDGVVTTGGTPGSNSLNWETDEEFQGFQGAVNWYVTWDDNNLYVGRVGGNNAEGSVIYIRADYPGSVYDTRGFNYDQLNPDVTPMGGVNFAAYLKTGYDEYRTYNGAWSAATTTLNPQFTYQGPTAHMEMVIPWSAITAGNGRPTNIRLILYQVVPAGIACPQEFVYGESPWGTGNINDGPSVGVNDGVPVSLRQPGGCDVGDSTAWRWWGCYPVIAGVGANGWTAVAPNAGPDDSICQTATAYFLQGNTPPGSALGTWSTVSQPVGSPPVNFTNPNLANSFAQNLTGFGAYTFVWDINYGGCPSLPDTVVILRVPNANPADVMGDSTITCNGDSVTLRGNDPGNGTGTWTTTGPGTIQNPSDSITAVTGLGPGFNSFTYTVSNGVCPATNATVNIYVPISVTADAGPDQELCLASLTTMAANDPVLLQGSAVGAWSQAAGPNAAIFTNFGLYSSNVQSLVPGSYAFVWVVSNGNCPVAMDTMFITNYDRPTADAGGDQTFCLGTPVTLTGNDFSSLGAAAYGQWSQLAGPGTATLSNPAGPVTAATNLNAGTYYFSWLVGNGVCPADSDLVSVVLLQVADQGIIDTISPDSGVTNGSISVATPIGGAPPYTYSLDGLNFVSTSIFDSLGSGPYTVYVMDSYGCSDSFTVNLIAIPPDTIEPPDTVHVPSGFSPNGDGNNDFWEIPGIENFPNAQLEVFNIWGGQVFQSSGTYSPWNGQRNGQDLPSATYYYILDLRTEGQPVLNGSVTILR